MLQCLLEVMQHSGVRWWPKNIQKPMEPEILIAMGA